VAKAAKVSLQENRLVRYLRETRSELRKVVWPTRQEAINLTVIVVAVLVAMAAILGLVDWLFTTIFSQILR